MASPDQIAAIRQRLGSTGVWLAVLRRSSIDAGRAAARTIEELGYGSLWEGEGVGANDVFVDQATWLAVTKRIVTGAGIANIWGRHPGATQVAAATLQAGWPGRAILGLGVSHAPSIAATGQVYERPLQRMREYLDGMDAAAAAATNRGDVVRVLAALRGQMLNLARDRADGAHPYFVTPEHTARARAVLGPDKLLIPEQAVVVETDPAKARAIAREHTSFYLKLPNYVNNLKELGFTDEDLSGSGSDRLVDSVVAWGDVDAVTARVHAHLDAGADHVLLQPLGPDVDTALGQLAELAPAILPAT